MATKNNNNTQILGSSTITVAKTIDMMVALYKTAPTMASFLWGKIGVGKSSAIKEVGRRLAADLSTPERPLEFAYQPTRAELHDTAWMEKHFVIIDRRLAQENPVDVKGLPAREADLMIWLRPEQLPTCGQGIIFYDEFNQAPKSVQAACYQGILDRAFGTHKIPDGFMQIAAGNRVNDRGVFYEMPAALANRFVHFEVDASLEEWTDWALGAGIRTEVVSFLQFKTSHLHNFDPARDQIRAFPTPRSWERVSTLMALPKDLRYDAVVGCIGEGAAIEFKAFLDVYEKLPNVDDILKGKETKVPAGMDVRYALAGALVDKLNDKNSEFFMQYVSLMPAEFAVLAVRFALRSDKKFVKTAPTFRTWILKNQSLLM